MPIVAMVAIDLLDMAVLRLTLAPPQHHSPVGQEYGRTNPSPDEPNAQGLAEDHDMIAAQEVDHGKRIQDERGASKIGA